MNEPMVGWAWVAKRIRHHTYAESLADWLRSHLGEQRRGTSRLVSARYNDPDGDTRNGIQVRVEQAERARDLLRRNPAANLDYDVVESGS